MEYKQDYLQTFNNELKEHVVALLNFGEFSNFISKKYVNLYSIYDYKEGLEYLSQVKNILNIIGSIANNPHSKTSGQEVITRSELVHQLSNQSFKETIKDTRLWKNKNGSMVPEYVHNDESIDSIITYENKFICLLINYIEEEINETIYNVKPIVESIEKQYETKATNYGKHSIAKALSNDGLPNQDFGNLDIGDSESLLEQASKLQRYIKNLKQTDFYRFNSANKSLINVMATNILIHDNLYSYCYRFYLDHYLNKDNKEKDFKNVEYYNFFVTTLLMHYKDEINQDLNIYYENNKLRFTSFTIKLGLFEIQFLDNDKYLSLDVNVKLKVADDNTYQAKYTLLIVYKYSNNIVEKLNQYKFEILNKIDDLILITQINEINNYNHVANISIYSKDNDLIINNIVSSFTMLFETKKDINKNVCPVCGEKHPSIVKNNYLCNSCKACYQVIKKDEDNTYLWIKTLRREHHGK